MSWKSMSGMFTANHSAIGFFSNRRSERWRRSVIQRGSPFHHEICSTTPGLMPFSGVNAYSTESLQPRSYLLRSRSKLVIAVLQERSTRAQHGELAERQFALPP